ncbi:hypothetical protein Tco_0353612 [Tanacetum coccineum]
MVSNEVKKSVIATWLIRSYKKQSDEYMEIKKQNEVYGLDAGMEYDPLNVDFDEWIDTDIFHFETPLCEAFKEFNQLLKINVDVLTNDTRGFKTYDDYKYGWIYEWNKDVPWVVDMPWLDYGPWMEPSDDIEHIYPPYYVNEEEERSKKRRCKLLGIPYVKPPTCKSEKFESSSPELDLFSDIKEHSEEETTEIMTETMEQYMSKTSGNYGVGRVLEGEVAAASNKQQGGDKATLGGQGMKGGACKLL